MCTVVVNTQDLTFKLDRVVPPGPKTRTNKQAILVSYFNASVRKKLV